MRKLTVVIEQFVDSVREKDPYSCEIRTEHLASVSTVPDRETIPFHEAVHPSHSFSKGLGLKMVTDSACLTHYVTWGDGYFPLSLQGNPVEELLFNVRPARRRTGMDSELC